MTGGCDIKFAGRNYWLIYTADAYFDIREKYGAEVLADLCADTRESYDIAIGCFCILAREGELVKRHLGYAPEEIPTENDIRRYVLPADITRIKRAVNDSFLAGLRIENSRKSEEPVDIGLLEYEKKTEITG